MVKFKLRVITITFLSFLLIGVSYENKTKCVPIHTPSLIEDTLMPTENTVVDSAFLDAIEHIKSFEGFRSNIYLDNDGSPTIGYGHHLLKGETYQNITDSVADVILKKDFQSYLDATQAKYDVKGDTLLALGLFSYNCGLGRLATAMSKGLLKNPKKILLYCHYKTYDENGIAKVHTSNKLLMRRKYEFALLS